MSAQRRSVHPNVPGVPWWGAVMIAVTATSIGFAFDAGGGKELTHVFATLYMIGCIAAILMVRQSGIFTAVVQPPMILFLSVPGAYFLFHGAKINGLKDVVINCAYPLIERFPLMVFTTGVVLLIGLGRWFVGTSRSGAEAKTDETAAGPFSALTAKLTQMLSGSRDADEYAPPKRRHTVDRSTSARSAQSARADKRAEPGRSRRPRTPEADFPPERRRRTAPSWQPDDQPADLPRRRPPAARTSRNPYERREPFERRVPHDRRGRYDSDDAFEAYEVPPRRRPGTNGAATTNGTHHPISRVRYRGGPTETESRQERPAARRNNRASLEAESWEYDI